MSQQFETRTSGYYALFKSRCSRNITPSKHSNADHKNVLTNVEKNVVN